MTHYDDILQFWFVEIKPASWFKKDLAFDELIIERFSSVHKQASNGELFTWRASAEGRLAEVIVLDQFSRNMFRDKPAAFAFDGMALVLAQEAVAGGFDKALATPAQRSFLYMPYMHSESLVVHEQAEALFRSNGLPANVEFELKHKLIIERFGRYPHRNKILGRESTEDELAFLQQANSSF